MDNNDFMEMVCGELYSYRDIFNNGMEDIIPVWLTKCIQNNKGLFVVRDYKGELYDYYIEATYNGNEDELYLDFYKKEFKKIIR